MLQSFNFAPDIAVIGAGPAGLMAAEILAAGGAKVTVYDRMPSAGRKFLLAGRGGLNLTHSEPLDRFLERYAGAKPFLSPAIEALPPAELRSWAAGLDQSTFVGSSGRVFPVAMKASPLLRAWLRRLASSGVAFAFRHDWNGWNERGQLLFSHYGNAVAVETSATILALGGASWPKLGSDGSWSQILKDLGIGVSAMRPSNCGFEVGWTALFRSRFAGAPLNGIEIRFGGKSVRGEAVITETGIEGGAIYALSAALRDEIETKGDAVIQIDLRPQLSHEELAERLASPRVKQSLSEFLRKRGKLPPQSIGLLYEAALHEKTPLAGMEPEALSALIKNVPIRLISAAPIERAISTAGGLLFSEIDDNFMVRKKPGLFVAGEMLDWEAPTGGYLLQACFATGFAAAHGALGWLQSAVRSEPLSSA